MPNKRGEGREGEGRREVTGMNKTNEPSINASLSSDAFMEGSFVSGGLFFVAPD